MSRRSFLRATVAGSAGWALPRLSWAAQGSSGGPLRVLFYTDIHARVEWDTPVAMEQAANAINRQDADLIIAGGDLITDGFQSSAASVEPRWEAYMKMHQAIRGDIHPVIGNHDLVAAQPDDGSDPSDDPRRPFRDRLGLDRTYQTFDAVGYRFFLLDSIQIGDEKSRFHGRINDEQLEWLDECLSSTPLDMPLIVVTHIPLLTAYYQATLGAAEPASSRGVVHNNVEVLRRFHRHNLLLVLQGHLHVNELLRWKSTTFVTGGAVCAKWWRGPWHGTEEGFGVATLHPDRVEWDYIDYGWSAKRPEGQ